MIIATKANEKPKTYEKLHHSQTVIANATQWSVAIWLIETNSWDGQRSPHCLNWELLDFGLVRRSICGGGMMGLVENKSGRLMFPVCLDL